MTTRGRTQPTQTLSAVGDAIPPSIPVVVLVDANTASASEIVTAALQDHQRATVVGTHTFGKGVFQEVSRCPTAARSTSRSASTYTPNGRNLGGGGIKQGAGVTPEVAVAHGVDSEHGLEVALNTLAAKSSDGVTVVAAVRSGDGSGRRSRTSPRRAPTRTGGGPRAAASHRARLNRVYGPEAGPVERERAGARAVGRWRAWGRR